MKVLKPGTNNSQRNTILADYSKLKSLVKKYPRRLFKKITTKSGKNNQGKITVKHRGGGHKKIYRLIDKRYLHDGIEGTVKSIEYDPYRSCFISFISYRNGSNAFIITPDKLELGAKVISGEEGNTPIKVGNNLPLRYIPAGTIIHDVELKPRGGGQLARSAGTCATLVGKDEDSRYIQIRLASKEVRRILADCRATIGKVSNSENNLVRLGKAGRKRWLGFRPTVRGVAMNARDHRHGGGEGKGGIGIKKSNRGKRTRKKNKLSNKFIVRSRHQY